MSFDGDVVKLLTPYKSGVQYYGVVDSATVPLDVQKVYENGSEYSEISVKGMYVWESAMD